MSGLSEKQVLEQLGFTPERYLYPEILKRFLERMDEGLSAANTMLKMLPTFVEPKTAPLEEKVVVLDAGGTNLRCALAHFDAAGKLQLEQFEKGAIPGLAGRVSAEEFSRSIATLAAPRLQEGRSIGFCFSYPTETTPDLDGRVICLTKGIDVPEMVGRQVGAELKNALCSLNAATPRAVVVLNDTTAALLAGEMAHPEKSYSAYVGFILGTGMNCAYTESNARISKMSGLDPAGSQAINIEAGNFADFPFLAFDQKLHNACADGSAQALEKAVSGAYLGRLVLFAFREAAAAGGFTAQTEAIINEWDTFGTHRLDALLLGKRDNLTTTICESDFALLKSITNAIIDRAANLAAVSAAGAVLRCVRRRGETRPVCVNLEGTTVQKMPTYMNRFRCALDTLINSAVPFELVSVDNAPIMGAAIAGLTQRG